jgi:hypothetical protein
MSGGFFAPKKIPRAAGGCHARERGEKCVAFARQARPETGTMAVEQSRFSRSGLHRSRAASET